MIELTRHSDGAVLPVRAQAGARQDSIKGENQQALKVSVTQVAEKGKANQALRKLLCKRLKFRQSQVELIWGETSSNKRFLVRGVSVDELRARIEMCLGDADD